MKTILTKKWLMALMLMLIPLVSVAQSYTVEYDDMAVEQVIRDLRQKTGYEFVYQKQVIKDVPNITAKVKNQSLSNTLAAIFNADNGLGYEIIGKSVVVKKVEVAATGKATISGTVVDPKGDPLPFATVRVLDSNENAVTDASGHFSITLAKRKVATLEFTYLGFKSVQRTYHPVKNMNMERIEMLEDESMLQDVVITGYQVLDKRSLTSAVTSVKMDDLARADMSSLDQMLEGKIPDLMVSTNSAEAGVAPKIRIRGTSTLVGNREPLWVVDGIIVRDPVAISAEELNDPDYVNRIGNAIAGINPQDIDRIDVLKDAAATAIYGSKAANGVIVVTTKRGYEGKPQVSYNTNLTVKLRPHYTDHSVDVMSSKERIQFSRELFDSHYQFPGSMTMVGYEKLANQLYNKQISFSEFQAGVAAAEAQNTDWFDHLTQNSLSQQHTVSLSGGSEKSRYYASLGYTRDNDVVKVNKNDRYTFSLNIDNTFSKILKASFTFNGYHANRDYYQEEIAPLQYAYQTSRAIPAYEANGDYSYYDRRAGG